MNLEKSGIIMYVCASPFLCKITKSLVFSPSVFPWNSLETISLTKNFVNEKNLHSIPE